MTIVTPLPDAKSRSLILAIFTSCGRCRFLDEKHFDACTALAGSGPAFVSLVLEAMADGAVMMGLPRAEALEIAAQSEYESLCFRGPGSSGSDAEAAGQRCGAARAVNCGGAVWQ